MDKKFFKTHKTQDAIKRQNVGSPSFLVLITALISIAVTFLAIYYINGGIVFVRYTRYGDLTKVYAVSEVIDNVDKNYYPYAGDMPTDTEMRDTAAKAIVDSLGDRYADYFTADEYASYSQDLKSSFKGIGITVQAPGEDGALIKKVYANSPAETAGLKPGDKIVQVNGTDVRSTSLAFVTALIGGEDGDAVYLTILRDGIEIQITAYYGDVEVPTVITRTFDGGIGYIMITQFGEDTAEEFDEALKTLQDGGITSLIIDLRNNPGGYLTSVIKIADCILDEGVIVSVGKSMDDPALEKYEAKKGGIDLPIAVLVNENSASASEILCAALKENGAAVVIGTTTYGKGIVQSTGQLYSCDSYLKITTDSYFTPKGNNIHGSGVTPDIWSSLDKESTSLIGTQLLPDSDDLQLQRAVSWISGK